MRIDLRDFACGSAVGAGLSTDSEVQKLLILMDCSAQLSLGFAEDSAKTS